MSKRMRGLTLLEVTIGMTVVAVIFSAVLSLATTSVTASIFNEDQALVEDEAHRGLQRMTTIIRKIGWTTQGGTTFPDVTNGATELRFMVMTDTDGNGYPFNQTTGELEWDSTIYTIRAEADGTLAVFDDANNPVWTLARNIASVSFATYLQDPSIELQGMRVVITASRDTVHAETLTSVRTMTIHMRN